MAYDMNLAQRIRGLLASTPGITEKHMYGGLSFLLDQKLLCGIMNDDLIMRVDPAHASQMVTQPHVRPMQYGGRTMRNFLCLSPKAYEHDDTISQWLAHCIPYVTSVQKNKKVKR